VSGPTFAGIVGCRDGKVNAQLRRKIHAAQEVLEARGSAQGGHSGSNRGLVLSCRPLFSNHPGSLQPGHFDKKRPARTGVLLFQKHVVFAQSDAHLSDVKHRRLGNDHSERFSARSYRLTPSPVGSSSGPVTVTENLVITSQSALTIPSITLSRDHVFVDTPPDLDCLQKALLCDLTGQLFVEEIIQECGARIFH